MRAPGWGFFIICLDILNSLIYTHTRMLRIFHYQPWYAYHDCGPHVWSVENLSLSALIYLSLAGKWQTECWESFIISLDILTPPVLKPATWLRIFHYQPWYTYISTAQGAKRVENLSLSALIYLATRRLKPSCGWESFIISLDILKGETCQPQ